MSVHAAVPEVVWCPANIIEMNMPVMMSAENCGSPSSSLIDSSTSTRSMSSLSGVGAARRFSMMPRDHLDQFGARRVADPEALDVHVRVDEGERVGALLQVVEDLRVPHVELLAELRADQARGRGVDRQLGEEVEQVDLAGVVQLGDHALDLARRSSRRGRA